MAELAGHWAAGTPMAETPWLRDAAQATQRYEEAVVVAVEACADMVGSTPKPKRWSKTWGWRACSK